MALGVLVRSASSAWSTYLEEVGLGEEYLHRYPHEFSGGQRQRICVARALTTEPEFIVCDECVSAMDVSVQAQVLNLLRSLQASRNLTYLFISHDLGVVKFMSDEISVMQNGKIVENGLAEDLYRSPKSSYTRKASQLDSHWPTDPADFGQINRPSA